MFTSLWNEKGPDLRVDCVPLGREGFQRGPQILRSPDRALDHCLRQRSSSVRRGVVETTSTKGIPVLGSPKRDSHDSGYVLTPLTGRRVTRHESVANTHLKLYPGVPLRRKWKMETMKEVSRRFDQVSVDSPVSW